MSPGVTRGLKMSYLLGQARLGNVVRSQGWLHASFGVVAGHTGSYWVVAGQMTQGRISKVIHNQTRLKKGYKGF